MTQTSKNVAIVGAGIVGVSTALWLQRAGHNVILIDRNGPAEGTSFGNAGILASASVVPVTVPGLFATAPRMLLDPDQPLFLRWSYLPRLLPWLIRYLKNANAADTRRIAKALAPIVGDSLADHQALAAGTPAEKWICPSDYLYLYKSRADFDKDSFGWDLRKVHGFEWTELQGDILRAYEPAFDKAFDFAVSLRNHGHIKDPGKYVKALAQHVVDTGGRLIKASVSDLVRDNGTVVGVRADGETIACDAALIATGAWSGPLARKLGLSIPLESERGYHVELWEPSHMPRAPTMVASGKFVLTPMDGRIRLAGIVELGGLEAPPSRAPFDFLRRHVHAVMPGLTWKEETEWMGHRPAPADSIPVIGEIPDVKGAFMGIGHHHVGLTGGPKTGRLLSQLICGQSPNLDLSAYLPSRYSVGG